MKKWKCNPEDRAKLNEFIEKQHALYGWQSIDRGMSKVVSLSRRDLGILTVLVEDYYRRHIEENNITTRAENEAEEPKGPESVYVYTPQPSFKREIPPKERAEAKATLRLVDTAILLNGKALGMLTLGELREYAKAATAHGRFYSSLYKFITGHYANLTSDALVSEYLSDAQLKKLAAEKRFSL